MRLAWKSLRHHRLVSLATILGVATGMCVVSTILIVDHNTARTDNQQEQLAEAVVVNGSVNGNVNAGEFDAVADQDSQARVVLAGPCGLFHIEYASRYYGRNRSDLYGHALRSV